MWIKFGKQKLSIELLSNKAIFDPETPFLTNNHFHLDDLFQQL